MFSFSINVPESGKYRCDSCGYQRILKSGEPLKCRNCGSSRLRKLDEWFRHTVRRKLDRDDEPPGDDPPLSSYTYV